MKGMGLYATVKVGGGQVIPAAFYLEMNSDTYVVIDQGPIVVMIENYRTQLCGDLFMANPEIWPILRAIGWTRE